MNILDKARKIMSQAEKEAAAFKERLRIETEAEKERPLGALDEFSLLLEKLEDAELITKEQGEEYYKLYNNSKHSSNAYPDLHFFFDAVIKENALENRVKFFNEQNASYLDRIVREIINDKYCTVINNGTLWKDVLIIDYPAALEKAQGIMQDKEDEYQTKVAKFKEDNKEALELYRRNKRAEAIALELQAMEENHVHIYSNYADLKMVKEEIEKLKG